MSNTDVKLFIVPWESDYKHILYFGSLSEQTNYFNNKSGVTKSGLTYQRKDNIIRYPAHIDDIYTMNYVRYKNSDYTDKYYYAFIKEMVYINDGMTEIHLETDVMQTYMFDYQVSPSFIEREHTDDDTVGNNLIDEGLELGEYISNSHSKANYATYCKIIVGVTEIIDEEGDGWKFDGGIYNGIYSGIKYYAFLNSSAGAEELKTFIKTYTDAGKSDSIVCMFLAPEKMLANYTAGNSVTQSSNPIKYYINGTGVETESDSQRLIDFDETLDGYTPRNNKLLTYPYRYLLVSNNAGGDVVYKYENWYRRIDDKVTKYKPKFLIEGCLTPGCSVRLIPLYYKNSTQNDVEGLTMGKFPTLNWTSDYFTNWLTQNAVNVNFSLLSGGASVVGGGAIVLAGLLTGAGAGIGLGVGGSMIAGGVSQITNKIGEMRKHDLTPAHAKGNLNSGDVTTASGTNDFHFYSMSIKEQYAKIIDDYFTMYGYKTHRVKVPNKNHRKSYWFTKTVDCDITGSFPNSDMQKIKDCYNNGVTFWRKDTDIGQYFNDNSII